MRTAERQNALNLLRKGNWFGGLPEDLQGLLLDNSMIRLAEQNQVLIAEDTRPTGMFGLLEGQIVMTRQIDDKKDFLIHLGGPGFWFGENGILSGDPTLVTATAHTKVRALFLPISNFKQIIEVEPRYYELFAQLALSRYAILIRALGQSMSLSPEEYLRIRLADLSDMIHSERKSEDIVELALSQADLAAMIGSSRQTTNVLLKKLESKGLIEVAFRKIKILDPHRLRGARRKTGL